MRHLEPTRRDAAEFPFRLEGRARFHHTDAMGVVHHASYLGFLEDARVEYLRAVGRPYGELRASGIEFAVIGVQVAYLAPLRFDERFTVHAGVAHVRRSSFAMEYLVEREDAARVLAGFTLHAALSTTSGTPVRVPEWIGPLVRPVS
jgi:acyl-CoA thioester hydrolase